MNTATRPSSKTDALRARVLESLSTAVLVLDEQLCVRYANPAAEQLLATSLTQLKQQPISVFFDNATWHAASLQHTLTTQQRYIQREARLHRPGTAHSTMVDYSVTPLSATQLLIEFQPLDRLLRMSREGSLSVANQATRAVVRGMAHEIKNPLSGIRGAAQLLARELDRTELREYTEVIINEADRLRALADRLLGARKPPDFKRINIHQVLERVRRVLQAETGPAIRIVRDYDPSLPDICGDMDQLIQVVLNIMRNAAQSLQETRERTDPSASHPPHIVLRSRARRQCVIGSQRHPLACVVEVEDNGPGLDPDLRETVFYPMVTGRSQGTGLGLPIAQSIMQQHGGLIECDSRPGLTVFRVLIPFNPAEECATGTGVHAP